MGHKFQNSDIRLPTDVSGEARYSEDGSPEGRDRTPESYY